MEGQNMNLKKKSGKGKNHSAIFMGRGASPEQSTRQLVLPSPALYFIWRY